jgi:large subunit ribosomal protein L24
MSQIRIKLKKGDNVRILSGNNRGRNGKILKMFPKTSRAIVQGANLVKMHRRPTQVNPHGSIEEKEAPIHVSNLILICPKCGSQTRVAYSRIEDARLTRVCRKCKEMIDA